MKDPLPSTPYTNFVSLQKIVVLLKDGMNLVGGVSTKMLRRLVVVEAKLVSLYHHLLTSPWVLLCSTSC